MRNRANRSWTVATAVLVVLTAPESPAAIPVPPPFVRGISSNGQYAIIEDHRKKPGSIIYSVHPTHGSDSVQTIASHPTLWEFERTLSSFKRECSAVSDDGRIVVRFEGGPSQFVNQIEFVCASGTYATALCSIPGRQQSLSLGHDGEGTMKIENGRVFFTHSFLFTDVTETRLDCILFLTDRVSDIHRFEYSLADGSFLKHTQLPNRKSRSVLLWHRWELNLAALLCTVAGAAIIVVLLVLISRQRPERSGK